VFRQISKVFRTVRLTTKSIVGRSWQRRWENLVDGIQSSAQRIILDYPQRTTGKRPPLAIPTAPLPFDHVYVVVSHGHLEMGPIPERDEIYPRFRRYRNFLRFAAAADPTLCGEYVLSLSDGHEWVPVNGHPTLTFNRQRQAVEEIALVPDVDFVASGGQGKLRRQIDRARIPWNRRVPQAFWRGSSTGPRYCPENTSLPNSRINLCRAATKFPELADFRIGRLVQGHEVRQADLAAEGIMGDFVSPVAQLKYRLLVSIDGNAGEWQGMFWKLYSGSCVLLVASEWEQWYSALLKPWEQFVTLKSDCGGVKQTTANAKRLAREPDNCCSRKLLIARHSIMF
jgi:hypothetical protein